MCPRYASPCHSHLSQATAGSHTRTISAGRQALFIAQHCALRLTPASPLHRERSRKKAALHRTRRANHVEHRECAFLHDTMIRQSKDRQSSHEASKDLPRRQKIFFFRIKQMRCTQKGGTHRCLEYFGSYPPMSVHSRKISCPPSLQIFRQKIAF